MEWTYSMGSMAGTGRVNGRYIKARTISSLMLAIQTIVFKANLMYRLRTDNAANI